MYLASQAPGGMLQIMVCCSVSLGFLIMHARAWPYTKGEENRPKLGCLYYNTRGGYKEYTFIFST